jgi:hypothetical protein
MKTLLEETQGEAIYNFTHADAIRRVVFARPDEGDFNHAALAEAEHAQWLAWLGVSE